MHHPPFTGPTYWQLSGDQKPSMVDESSERIMPPKKGNLEGIQLVNSTTLLDDQAKQNDINYYDVSIMPLV
ncbi:hypothetical protein BC938DRAFT_471759 [Jimgerdemannia flammicorona]|uniref:Uncharacterized protein n=1 Tax=Jimgerdemannia flammicorona TaxID=994334 RepID=A0A433QUK6_9FUNG|nr:hypothetical protein BC938DRAFT_471759 [Jimgerdemannia flammicorona]